MVAADMKTIKDINNIETGKDSAVAIGNFDGFHLGHRRLIETLKKAADERDLVSMVLTFVPNPKIYFNKTLHLINSDEQKTQILEQLDVDKVYFLNFDQLLDLSPETFVKDILVGVFNVKYMVMGENFKFGKNRRGDVETLKKMAEKYGFEFTVVNPVILDGITISSSLIREKLGHAEIEESNRMLGRLYYIDGIVAEGDKIGRQLGFPTINIETGNEILPEGVFKTSTEVDGQLHDSITYIGSSPTFAGTKKKVETHILNFDRIVYGKKVRVYFEKKLRNEMKFDSKNNLINQIKNDIQRLKVDKEVFF
jgi:riboflavin kinase/FMN adenylyltransferase